MKKIYYVVIIFLLTSVAMGCSVTNVYRCPPCLSEEQPGKQAVLPLPHKAILTISNDMGQNVATVATAVVKKELFKNGIFVKDSNVVSGDYLTIAWNLSKSDSWARLKIVITHNGKIVFDHKTVYGVVSKDPDGWMCLYLKSFYGSELRQALKKLTPNQPRKT